MEQNNPLGEEKISKLLLKFSIPAIVGMMVNALYNIVDRIYIGNSPDLGQQGLAGITIAFPLMLISLALGVLFGFGGATLFSIKLGEKKHHEAANILGNAFLMLVLVGILYMVLGQIFLRPILIFLGASEVTLPYAVEYMRVIFWGSVFQTVSIGLNSFMRADGSPKLAMLTMFLGAGTNIVLDPLFIFVFKMGMFGAAFATIISQFISFVWVIAYFIGNRSKNKLNIVNLKPKFALIFKIISLGMPGFLLQFVSSLLNSILNKNLFFYGGDIAVSSMGIINSLQTVMLMPLIGLNQGIQPIISFNYGAKKYDRVKKAEVLTITVATALAITGFILIFTFPILMISLFNHDPDLLDFTRPALLTWMLFLPVLGFQIIASNFFQATGRPGISMFLTLTRQVIFLMPALIVFPMFWKINGIFYAAPFAESLSAILTGVLYYFGLKRLVNRDDNSSFELNNKCR